MRLTFLAIFQLGTFLASAQGLIERYYPLEGAVGSQGGIVDEEGGLVHVASIEGDFVVMRLLATGEVDWINTYPLFTQEGFYGPGVVSTSAGIFVAGYTIGVGTQSRDAILLHIDTDGTLLSTKRIDVAGSSNAFHSVTRTDQGFLVTGRCTPGGSSYDMWMSLFDENGGLLWSRSYGSSDWDWGYQAIPLADGGFAMVGYGDAVTTQTSAYVVRTDATGNEIWARGIGSGPADEGYTIAEDDLGNLYVGGRTLGMGVPPPHVSGFITKLSPAGDHLWTRVLPNSIEMVSLKALPSGGGVTWVARPQNVDGGQGGYDIGWGVLDADGVAVLTKLYGREQQENVQTMIPSPNGGWYIMGSTNSHPQGYAFFVLEIDAEGNAGCIGRDWDNGWIPFEPNVTPFESIQNEGAAVNDLVMGTTAGTIMAIDPCCALMPLFEATQDETDPYAWTFTNLSTGVGAFQWDFGDGNGSSELSPTHTFSGNGDYTVCLTMTAECGSEEFCAPVPVTVGVEQIGRTISRVYPVPANDQLRVVLDGEIAEHASLIDVQGRRVPMQFSTLADGLVSINVQTLAPGSYTLEFTFVSGNTARVPVIVMR